VRDRIAAYPEADLIRHLATALAPAPAGTTGLRRPDEPAPLPPAPTEQSRSTRVRTDAGSRAPSAQNTTYADARWI